MQARGGGQTHRTGDAIQIPGRGHIKTQLEIREVT